MLREEGRRREPLDELPMLSLSIQRPGSRASSDDKRRAFSKRVAPDVRHEHLLKSGPLSKCNDPLCTTCPAYFSSIPNPSYYSRRPSYASGRNRGYLKVFLCNLYAKFPFPRGIINPHTKAVQRWNRFFLISCLCAVFLDPLFFFLLRVDKDNRCIVLDRSFTTTVIVLRTLTDSIYLMHIILQFRLAYVAPVGTDAPTVNKDQATSDLVDDPRQVALHYLKTWFLIDFVAVLPLPQIMMAVVVYGAYIARANIAKNLLRVTLLLQNLPRMFRVLPLLAGHGTNGFLFENAWANFVINLSLYVLAGHVVGSSWYLFALQRVNECFRDACHNATTLLPCDGYLDCGTGTHIQARDPRWINDANATNCLAKDSYVFMYGIYANGVPVTMEPSFFPRYVYSTFWGFQQITTLAGNQMPSLFIWEVVFLILVIGLGLLLLTLLIGNMQNFLQALGRRGLEMQLRRYEMEKWMARRNMPLELKKRVRQYERFSWAARRGVNEEELLGDLPEDLHRTIRQVLFMDLVKKVRLLEVMDAHLLDAIYQRLHQKLYIDGSEILRRGAPVQQMLFIVHGTLVSEVEDGSAIRLSTGDICGEELLTWCLEHATDEHTRSSHGRLGMRYRAGQRAISSRTVICTSNVEAFSLECSDLEEVTRDFNRLLRSSRVRAAIRYESHFIREWAALTIQVFWRYRKRKLGSKSIGARRHHRRR